MYDVQHLRMIEEVDKVFGQGSGSMKGFNDNQILLLTKSLAQRCNSAWSSSPSWVHDDGQLSLFNRSVQC